MKKILFAIVLSTLCSLVAAQGNDVAAPKWTAKAQKSIVALIAYDRNNEMLHEGTATYISNDGVAVTDYATLRNAYSAVVVDADGRKSNVVRILGADETYGVVKFLTDNRKSTPLPLAATTDGATGTTAYALPYYKGKRTTCPAAQIEKKDAVEGNYAYYTLNAAFAQTCNGAPLLSSRGELLGIVQSPFGGKSYATDARFAQSLSIAAIQSKSATLALDNIHMPKGLPDSKEESLVYLYFKSRSADNDEYIDLLNLFVATYPDVAEGYLRRATPLIDLQQFDNADRDLQTYLRLASDKAAAHASVADVIYTKLRYQPTPEYPAWTYDIAVSHIDQSISATQAHLAAATTDSLRNAIDANLLKYQLQKALILTAKQDDSGAIAIYDDINNGPHRSPATLYASSMAHQARGDSLSLCIQLLDSAIALFPTPKPQEAANYYLRRAELLAACNRNRESVADYNQFCYLNNNNVTPAFYYERFAVEKQGRMYQQALDDINLAIDGAPREPFYRLEKSGLLLIVNQLDECIATARECLALDPNNADALRIMGYAQLQQGDRTAARSTLQRAVDLGDEGAREIIDTYLK